MAKHVVPKLSDNALVVLERRYLARDDGGKLIETPEGLLRRVAGNVALAEEAYGESGNRAIGQSGKGAGKLGEASRGSTLRPRSGQAGSPRTDAGAVGYWEGRFYELMASLRFLPNSPTLGNAGRPLQQLSACFVLPVEDSMVSIFDAVKQTALIHQSGGGTGFAFSRLRPAGDVVQTTGGVASGPVSFMRVFDAATEAIKQGGTRRGANMAILDVHHPDIEAFINVKADMTTLTNFNISVGVDEAFMGAVEADSEYELINPRTREVVGRRRARAVFDQIVANAWRNGDPGLVFLDRINDDNPTPQIGPMEATNPCGEQPLLPYESCNLGSLNLARFVRETAGNRGSAGGLGPRPEGQGLAADGAEKAPIDDALPHPLPNPLPPEGEGTSSGGAWKVGAAEREVDWEGLAEVIPVAVRFLDDVIDMNAYPVPQIEVQTKLTRKIGLGVMGFADMLFQLGIPYDSEEALALAGRLMGFIRERADAASEALAVERGVFPAWEGSIYGPGGATGIRAYGHTGKGELERAGQAAGALRGPQGERFRGAGQSGNLAIGQAGEGRVKQGEAAPGPEGRGLAAPRRLRNSTRTTVAPTGTLSIIADCTGGIEPAFALAFTRSHYLDPKQPTVPVRLTEVNKVFEAACRASGCYSEELMEYLAAGGSLHDRAEVPHELKRLFVTSHDIAPGWHVRMQAAFQRHTDNAVSKTINFPRAATIADVGEAYLLAYREGCKGITIYRDGSRAGQVLSHVAEEYGHTGIRAYGHEAPVSEALSLAPSTGLKPRRRRAGAGTGARNRYTPPRPALPLGEIDTTHGCPDCGSALVFSEGCLVCRSCGFTRCG